MMFRKKELPAQTNLWIATHELDVPAILPFYDALNRIFDDIGFGDKVRTWCEPFYTMDGPGSPGTDPEVFFKMLMVGYFEQITSERAIALRCSDSRGIRTFLGFDLTEKTPSHANLSDIRLRLSDEVFEKVFYILHEELAKQKLLSGKYVGIDTSIIEANASLRELTHKETGKKYRAYVKQLAAEDGVDTKDEQAVNRFDRNRKGKKLSNDDWEHPHDPDAKVGRDKKGATRMLYHVEHIIDLETNALATRPGIFPGDEADSEHPTDHLIDAEMRAAEGIGDEEMDLPIKIVTADMGYHSAREVAALAEYGIMANIPDPTKNRNMDKLKKDVRAYLEASHAFTKSDEGKKWLRKRAEMVERSFAHTLESGGMRRSTLRGTPNIKKRHAIAGLCLNLSLLIRKHFKYGTPRQWVARAKDVTRAADGLVFLFLQYISGNGHSFSSIPVIIISGPMKPGRYG